MDRRTVLQSMGLVTSHALFPSILSGFVTSCGSGDGSDAVGEAQHFFFTREEMDAIRQIIDLILPKTTSSNASSARVHRFMDEVFAKCMPPDQQAVIKAGLKGFIPELKAAEDPLKLLEDLDRKAFNWQQDFLWFVPIKQYAMIGFFTSKEGTTVASNYVPVPGDYKGEVPLEDTTLNYGMTALRYYI